jgi:carbamoyltransferase
VKRNYIGLATSFHDSALAIVDSSGKVVFAESTERCLQTKRALCIAPDLVHRTGELVEEHCEAGAEIVVAHTWAKLPRLSASQLAAYLSRRRANAAAVDGESCPTTRAESAASKHAAMAHWAMTSFSGHNLDFELGRIDWRNGAPSIVRRYDHHLTHAVTACYSSPFERALCAIVDGFGEHSACAFYRYDRGELTPIEVKGESRGSLGFFYEAACTACGFGRLTGEEWKVMGLAAYGRHDENLVALLRKMIRVNGLALEQDDNPELKRAMLEYSRKPGQPPISAANLAFASQLVYTEVMLQLLHSLAQDGFSRNLVLGGGCALNSSTNGAILAGTPFEKLHVFSAPGDDGNAVGAAWLAFREDNPSIRAKPQFQSPYLGSRMSGEAKENAARFGKHCALMRSPGDPPKMAAQLLASGKIIGWVQGRAEFGPRALGNRSILADPRSPEIKDEINGRVKFREEYRPFAPSILHEFGGEYFEDYAESPYMERTLRFRESAAQRVPGVVHADGTGRLQTVKREWNEPFYRLIEEFHALTRVPLVLNTSLNVMGRPIAHSVEDVIAMFHTTGLDAVFIDDLLFEK